MCATKRAVDDDGVCKQAYDRVQRNGRSTTTAYASGRSSVCATYRAVNDDVVAPAVMPVVGSSRSEGSVCMCDTCDLSALDSAQ